MNFSCEKHRGHEAVWEARSLEGCGAGFMLMELWVPRSPGRERGRHKKWKTGQAGEGLHCHRSALFLKASLSEPSPGEGVFPPEERERKRVSHLGGQSKHLCLILLSPKRADFHI